MRALLFLATCIGTINAERGYFWHLTDLHLDPNYTATSDPLRVCPSAGDQLVTDAGKWGHYLCDSPYVLINSSINAMKSILPDPDFILWTGDDTPHVPNEKLSEEIVLGIVEWLTNVIRNAFPTTKVYSALGNHDFHPKSQLPPQNNSIYNRISELWSPWLNTESIPNFQKGAFYSEEVVNIGPGSRVIVLNTNLYYDSNSLTANMEDPGDQFQWLENELTRASQFGEKVYIVGHVPPGYFEKKRGKPWFRENFNKRYVEIIQKHYGVIQGQFFGHHHTDSFRMFYSDKGTPISAMFIAPGITPWKTTLPGVDNGANNPGIRVFEYDKQSLKILDMVTYYLNLTYANKWSPRWEKEYRLTEAFQVPDGTTQSMHSVLEKISTDHCYLQKYYDYNSVNYDLETCDASCRVDHVCAIREVDFAKYDECVKTESSSYRPIPEITLISLVVCIYLESSVASNRPLLPPIPGLSWSPPQLAELWLGMQDCLPPRYRLLDLLFALFGTATFLLDLGSDVFGAVRYYQAGDRLWAALQLGFYALSSAELQLLSWGWFWVDRRENRGAWGATCEEARGSEWEHCLGECGRRVTGNPGGVDSNSEHEGALTPGDTEQCSQGTNNGYLGHRSSGETGNGDSRGGNMTDGETGTRETQHTLYTHTGTGGMDTEGDTPPQGAAREMVHRHAGTIPPEDNISEMASGHTGTIQPKDNTPDKNATRKMVPNNESTIQPEDNTPAQPSTNEMLPNNESTIQPEDNTPANHANSEMVPNNESTIQPEDNTPANHANSEMVPNNESTIQPEDNTPANHANSEMVPNNESTIQPEDNTPAQPSTNEMLPNNENTIQPEDNSPANHANSEMVPNNENTIQPEDNTPANHATNEKVSTIQPEDNTPAKNATRKMVPNNENTIQPEHNTPANNATRKMVPNNENTIQPEHNTPANNATSEMVPNHESRIQPEDNTPAQPTTNEMVPNHSGTIPSEGSTNEMVTGHTGIIQPEDNPSAKNATNKMASGHAGTIQPEDNTIQIGTDLADVDQFYSLQKHFYTSRHLFNPTCLAILHFLQLGYPLRCIHSLEVGIAAYKTNEGRSSYEQYQQYAYFLTHDISMMRLVETFLENTPQLILLLYIVLQRGTIQTFQYFSITMSFISIAWAILDYHQSLRMFLKQKQKLNIISGTVYFLWNCLLILARIVCIVLFTAVFHCLIALHFLMVWLVFFMWATLQKTTFMENSVLEYFYRATVAVILYFSWFNIADGKTITRCFIYHIFILIDSVLILLPCTYTRLPPIVEPYKTHILIAVTLAFMLGLLLRLLYYKFLHPNLESQKKDTYDEVDVGVREANGAEYKSLILEKKPTLRNPRMLNLSRQIY
ncbi:acid sphingomyelinase-like phosphodiesterase 3b [Discoglossus pictus]